MANRSDKNYFIHPHYIIISLVLASITALFLGFSIAYLYTRIQSGITPLQLPALFYFNSLLLISSSFTLKKVMNSYKQDQTQDFKNYLWLTLILTICFLLAQIFAWRQLYEQDVFLQNDNLTSYLYVISGLHFLHVVAGIPFLVILIKKAYRYMKNPPGVLVYFSDPAKKRSLKIVTIYWHFLDILWIYLVLFFLINYLIA